MNDLTTLGRALISRAMAIRPLLILPDPKLRLVSEPVRAVTDEIRALARDMLDTMYDAPGVGLAAIQIGEAKRVITMDVSKDENERRPMVLINPEILWRSEEKRTYEEGCLSIPEYYEEVERPDRVRFRYTNLDGRNRRAGRGGPDGDLRAARDRPSQRRTVHRLPVEAEARPGGDEVPEGGEARGRGRMSLRVVFMGTPDFAVPTLSEIVGQGHEVAAVYTRAPAAAGRGMELKPSPVHRMAQRFGLPVLTPRACGARRPPSSSGRTMPTSPSSSPTA